MTLSCVYSNNFDEMETIKEKLASVGYVINSEGDNYILVKKRAYGKIYIHLVLIAIAIFYTYPVIFLNLIYFGYNYIKKSNYILITTEKTDKDGNDLEFMDLEEILNLKR
ncbi:hypothetical protein [Methanobrevibacter sp. DSM 116169]|uniref:hypothetical protein n=1 Tax=Methanobrevibacter sp. DSM 116169 TaxID=3242727 RepID=UPI0038FC7F2C